MRGFHQDVRSYNKWQQTYKLIVQVSHGIFNDIYDYGEIPNPDAIVDTMHDIAFINVKKVGGGSRVNQKEDEISQHYKKHSVFLHKQIEKISPNIIINCSGVWQLFEDLSVSPIKAAAPFHHSFNDGKLIINAYHPGQSTITQDKYFDVIAEIRKLSGR